MDNYKKKYLKYKLKYLNLKKSSKVNNNFNKQSFKIKLGGAKASQSNTDILNNILKDLFNLKIKDVGGGGDCQFRALADQLNYHKIQYKDIIIWDHTKLRALIVDYIKENPDETIKDDDGIGDGQYSFKQLILLTSGVMDINEIPKEQAENIFNEYIRNMYISSSSTSSSSSNRGGTWGDAITIAAARNLLNIQICIISQNNSKGVDCIPDGTNKSIITLGHIFELHYVSTEPLSQEEKLEHLKLKLKNMQFDLIQSDNNDLISNLNEGFYDKYLNTLIDKLKNIDEAIKFFKVNIREYLGLIENPIIPRLSSTNESLLGYDLKDVHKKGFAAYYKEKMLRLIKQKTEKEANEGRKFTLIPNESEIKYVADNLENIDNVYDFLYYNKDLLIYLIDDGNSYSDLVKEELKKCFEEANKDFDTYKITAQTKAKEIYTKIQNAEKLKQQSYGSTPAPPASLFESPEPSVQSPPASLFKSPEPSVQSPPASLFESPEPSASLFESSVPSAPKETASPPVVPPASSVVPPAPSPPVSSVVPPPVSSVVPLTSASLSSSPPSKSYTFKTNSNNSDSNKLSQEALDAMAVVGGGLSIIILFILTISVN